MDTKRLLFTINFYMFCLFGVQTGMCQTTKDGVSLWATAGPNYSIIREGDFIDNPWGSMVLPRPGWHLGFSTYVPFTFRIPNIETKLLFIANLELTQINYQYAKDLSLTHYISNSNIFSANIGLGKYFRLSDKLGMRFSIQQGIFTSKMNKDSKEDIYIGSNKFEMSTVFKIKNRKVLIGLSSFAGPQSFFDLRYETWCIGKLKVGQCLENRFRALQLDVGIQLWNHKK